MNAKKPNPWDMLTVQQVAPMLGVSKMTVYRIIHANQLRAYRVGRGFRIRRDDLCTYLGDADTFAQDAAS